ncbi:MAG: FAD-dependent oxidoreductase [Chloroflexota bacterium]
MKHKSEQQTNVIILGGGYAGMMAALRLAGKVKKRNVQLTLINGQSQFVERIRLHQKAANQSLPHRSYTRFLSGTNIQFVQGLAAKIDPQAKMITVQSDKEVQMMVYDYLVYALGSTVDTTSVPGVAQYAESLADLNTTEHIQAQLLSLSGQAGRILIVGGGLTGIEAATEIAETYPDLQVSLLTRRALGDDLSEKGAAYLVRVCDRLRITLLEEKSVCRLEAQQAYCDNGMTIPFDLCLWAGAFRVPSLASDSDIPTNPQQRIMVDECLRSLAYPEIYAVGDAAFTPLRMACATAMPMGCYAADHLANQILAAPLPPAFEFGYAMRCISLGRGDALIQMVKPDDAPKGQIYTGRMAVWIKELICRATIWMMFFEKRFPGAYRWPKARLARSHDQTNLVTS